MGKLVINDASAVYFTKFSSFVSATRSWATLNYHDGLNIPLAYTMPYGNKAFVFDFGTNQRSGQPYKNVNGAPGQLSYIPASSAGINDTSNKPKVVILFTLTKFSTVFGNYTKLEENISDPAGWNTRMNGSDTVIQLNRDDYADWYIFDWTFLDNSDNGNYDDFNRRKVLANQNNWDIIMPIEMTKYRNYTTSSNYRDYEGDYRFGLSFVNCMRYQYDGYQQYFNFRPFFSTPTGGDPWQVLGKNVNLYNISGTNKSGKHYTIVPNTDALQAYCDLWGVPCFFDDSAFTDNTPEPGQPDNPTDPDTPGSGDNNVDPMIVDIPSIIPISPVTNQYAATGLEVGKLIDWLMTDDFLTNISKFFNEPTEYLIGCKYYPFDLSLHSPLGVGPAGAYRVGNMNTPIGVTAAPIYSDYNRKLGECSFLVEPYYGNFLDYSPYSAYDLYLPYIGYKSINPNDVVNRTLKVVYYTDLTEGRVLAQVWTDTTMLESYEGQLAYDIPLSSSDGRERAVKTIQMAANAVSTIGGAAYGGAAFGTSKRVANRAAKAAVGGAISAAPDIISQVTSMAPQIDKGGAVSSDINGFNPQDVYLIMTRPIMAQPKNFAQVQGYAASYGGTVSEFSGYLQCREISGGTGATAAENDMINELLRGGIHID